MICTGLDNRNVLMAMDLVQAKQIVSLLRMLSQFPNCNRLLVDASEVVNKDGFSVTADNVRTACSQFADVIGFRTDMCVRELPAAAISLPDPEQPPVPPDRVN